MPHAFDDQSTRRVFAATRRVERQGPRRGQNKPKRRPRGKGPVSLRITGPVVALDDDGNKIEDTDDNGDPYDRVQAGRYVARVERPDGTDGAKCVFEHDVSIKTYQDADNGRVLPALGEGVIVPVAIAAGTLSLKDLSTGEADVVGRYRGVPAGDYLTAVATTAEALVQRRFDAEEEIEALADCEEEAA